MAVRSHGYGTLVVLVTCPNQEVGETLGRVLVEERLAACVNVIPGLRSIYGWEGKICQDPEVFIRRKRREFLDKIEGKR